MAIAQAERIRIGAFDAKEVILADLKYGPDGTDPDPERYDHALQKTAFFLAHFGGFFMFPPTTNIQNIGTEALIQELSGPYSLREAFMEAIQPDHDTGDDSALKITIDVLEALPIAHHYLAKTPVCKLLRESISHWSGSTKLGVDKELGEIFIRVSGRVGANYGEKADVSFYRAEMAPDFKIVKENEFISGFYSLSAIQGHPLASLWSADFEETNGNISEALEFLQIAAQQGVTRASDLLEKMQQKYNTSLSDTQKSVIDLIVEDYQNTRCRHLD
jgi:hypothetical protein